MEICGKRKEKYEKKKTEAMERKQKCWKSELGNCDSEDRKKKNNEGINRRGK